MGKRRSDPSLDELASLYEVQPTDFIEARNALVAQLKERGAEEAAREVKALRRPPLSLWAVNQLARRSKAAVEELLDAGAALQAAHRNALKGRGGDALREGMRRFQEAVGAATTRAAQLLEAEGHTASQSLQRIQATLHAAATGTEEEAEALRKGALTAELGPQGFDEVPALRLVPSGSRTVKRAAAAKRATARVPPRLTPVQDKKAEEAERKSRAQRAADLKKLKALEQRFEIARKLAVTRARLAESSEKKAASLREEATGAEREMFELKRQLEEARRGLEAT